MAWRTEKTNSGTDIICDGFENGIADDPYEGLADMRNINNLSTPKEAPVGFATGAVALPPVLNTVAFTTGTASITIASTAGFYPGMAIIINTLTGGSPLSATAGSNTFYVTPGFNATTFSVSIRTAANATLNITTGGSGTLSTAQFGLPVDSAIGCYPPDAIQSKGQLVQSSFILDDTGQLWMLSNGTNGYGLNTLQFCGNTNHSSATAGSWGLTIFGGYLLVFLGTNIDTIRILQFFGTNHPNGNWTIGWQTTTDTPFGHKAIAATDGACYFCNFQAVGSILEVALKVFDPSDATTYTYNPAALALPPYDFARCLAQLGTLLLVGGELQYVYPWDRVSTSFNYPLIVAETCIYRIVSTNSTAYIFAGNRGRIYQTNGANIQLFKKFPDQLSGTETPFYTWGDAIYMRNQIYFGISATTNGGTSINNFAGVWGLSLEMANTLSSVAYGSSAGPLKLLNSLSYGTYSGTVPVLIPMGNVNPTGNGFYVGWINSTGGVDYSAGTPYTNYEAYIDTDMIPVGTYYDSHTNMQVEYKLAKPLVTGEGVQIWWRGNLTDAFTQITSVTSVVGELSGAGPVNFQKQQWVQLRIKLASTATNPSYTRLREVRMR